MEKKKQKEAVADIKSRIKALNEELNELDEG